MKKIIFIIALLATVVGGKAQSAYYGSTKFPLKDVPATDLYRYLNKYVGKSVADLLNDLTMPVGSFVVNPNYNNPDYANEFRFTNYDVNSTSTIIHANQNPFGSGELYIFYIKFKPQLKYPTTGFINANKEKPLSPDQYAEFEKYKIVDIGFSVFPR